MAGNNHDYLENRLKMATADDAIHMLEEFLRSFYRSPHVDKISPLSDPELNEVTLDGHVTE